MGGRSIKKYLSRAPSREDPDNENSDGEGKKSKRPSKESRRESFSKDPELNKFRHSVRYITHRASLVGITPTMTNYQYLTINPGMRQPPIVRRADLEAMTPKLDVVLSANSSARSSCISTASHLSTASRRKRSNFSWDEYQNVSQQNSILEQSLPPPISPANNKSTPFDRQNRNFIACCCTTRTKSFDEDEFNSDLELYRTTTQSAHKNSLNPSSPSSNIIRSMHSSHSIYQQNDVSISNME